MNKILSTTCTVILVVLWTIRTENLLAQTEGECAQIYAIVANEVNPPIGGSISDSCQNMLKLIAYYKRIMNHPRLKDCPSILAELRATITEAEAIYKKNCGQGKLTSNNGNNQSQDPQSVQQRAAVVLEIQSMHSAEQQNRREYYQAQLEGWKKDLAKYNGASFGSEVSDSYYEEKHTDSKASASVQQRLQNYKLDDDEFAPGDMPVSEPDNMFVRVSEEELKRRLEQAKEESKKERDEKETQMCVQADDGYVSRLPPALQVDPWNNPVNEVSMLDFVRKNGKVLYQADGVVFTYLIYRAIHESGLSYKVCSVDPSSYRHSKDRSLSDDGRVFHRYNLYYILENKSDTTTVTFQRFPSIEISMTGESSWGLCDEWLCAGSERFGNDAKLNMVASPHIMQPNSIVWEFEGAWYPADRPAPQLSEWVVGKFYTQPYQAK